MAFESFVKMIQNALRVNSFIKLLVLLNLGITGLKIFLKIKIYLGFLPCLRMINLSNIH